MSLISSFIWKRHQLLLVLLPQHLQGHLWGPCFPTGAGHGKCRLWTSGKTLSQPKQLLISKCSDSLTVSLLEKTVYDPCAPFLCESLLNLLSAYFFLCHFSFHQDYPCWSHQWLDFAKTNKNFSLFMLMNYWEHGTCWPLCLSGSSLVCGTFLLLAVSSSLYRCHVRFP